MCCPPTCPSWMRWCLSMATIHPPKTLPKSKPRYCFTLPVPTNVSMLPGPRMKPHSRPPGCTTQPISTPAPSMASTTTPHRALTPPAPHWPGNAPWRFSKKAYGAKCSIPCPALSSRHQPRHQPAAHAVEERHFFSSLQVSQRQDLLGQITPCQQVSTVSAG